MGIVRTVATRLLAPYETAYPATVNALAAGGVTLDGSTNPLVGEVKRSLRKNRWAATVTAALRVESSTTTVVDWSIDMLGDRHHDVIDDILAAMSVPVDDLGVADALERLGKTSRLFGYLEARRLADYIHLNERVVELAQGVYDGHQGMLVLTTQRVFFFDVGLKRAKVEEFALSAIGSISLSKRLGGEAVEISTSGRAARIKQLAHGGGETFVSAFHRMRADASSAVPPTSHAAGTAVPDLADQIRKLSELRDAGILTEQEFVQKKTELLGRM